jgi:hypothetical protein
MQTREMTDIFNEPFGSKQNSAAVCIVTHNCMQNVTVFALRHTHFCYGQVSTTLLLREMLGRRSALTESSERAREAAWVVLLTYTQASTHYTSPSTPTPPSSEQPNT